MAALESRQGPFPLRESGRMYVCCETHHVSFEVRNKVMDALQEAPA